MNPAVSAALVSRLHAAPGRCTVRWSARSKSIANRALSSPPLPDGATNVTNVPGRGRHDGDAAMFAGLGNRPETIWPQRVCCRRQRRRLGQRAALLDAGPPDDVPVVTALAALADRPITIDGGATTATRP